MLGGSAGAFVCTDANAMLGANTREELATLNEIARGRVFERLYAEGVDIPQTDGVLIGPDVTIGRDTLILPGTVLIGKSQIGSDCVIGPASTIKDCLIKDGCIVEYAYLNHCKAGCRARIGPFSRINPGGVIADDGIVGSYIEI
jgi:bifunctional UDP-N-acetylglucosamine pyrophosphorylase/glucosamine-1-phosphate N-acetyltransferase